MGRSRRGRRRTRRRYASRPELDLRFEVQQRGGAAAFDQSVSLLASYVGVGIEAQDDGEGTLPSATQPSHQGPVFLVQRVDDSTRGLDADFVRPKVRPGV